MSICSSMIQISSTSSTPPNRDNTKQVQNTAVPPIIFAVTSYVLVEMQVYEIESQQTNKLFSNKPLQDFVNKDQDVCSVKVFYNLSSRWHFKSSIWSYLIIKYHCRNLLQNTDGNTVDD